MALFESYMLESYTVKLVKRISAIVSAKLANKEIVNNLISTQVCLVHLIRYIETSDN